MTILGHVQPAPAQGGVLALLRGAGRGLLSLPRPVAAATTLGWCAWIWWHSSKPGNRSVDPDFWWGWFTNLGHAPAFAFVALGLAVLALRPARRTGDLPALGPGGAALVVAATAAYGAVDEVHQAFVFGRTASWWDLCTDTLGAGATVVVVIYLGRRGATNRGLALRLALGALACFASALMATLVD